MLQRLHNQVALLLGIATALAVLAGCNNDEYIAPEPAVMPKFEATIQRTSVVFDS